MSDMFGTPRRSNYRSNRFRKRKSSGIGVYAIGLLIALAAVFVIGLMANSYFSTSTQTGCVISEKDRVSKSEGGSEMRVYTDNCGTFVVGDNLFVTDMNSADRYGKIKVGETYDISSYGWRNGLFSMFPKIKEINPS